MARKQLSPEEIQAIMKKTYAAVRSKDHLIPRRKPRLSKAQLKRMAETFVQQGPPKPKPAPKEPGKWDHAT